MAILETRDLTKSFGGLTAVDHVTLAFEPDCITSIIGPNGAGKTTFFNLIGGSLKPDFGSISFDGEDITNLPIHKIVSKGISRSFQILNLYDELSVEENIWIGVQSHHGHGTEFFSPLSGFPAVREKTLEIIQLIGLAGKEDETVKFLPYGERRLLEIGLSLTLEPKLLLLDEPMSGLGVDERPRILRFIKNLADKLSIILVEHDMEAVMSVSGRIAVMHQGRLLAQGTPDEIKGNAEVQDAYLGELR
ncbi:MAG: ABC transporter ATP-binding protein [Deltaproteobacteria bacterium]|nr:ABC transporter ATP-binding protein [Deltaproteobacteria bacterium]